MLGRGLQSLIPPQEPSDDGELFSHDTTKATPSSTEQAAHQSSLDTPAPQNNEITPPPEEDSFAGSPPPIAEAPEDEPVRNNEPVRDVGAILPTTDVGARETKKYHDESLRVKEPVFHIEVSKIKKNPYQPRQAYDEEDLNELANSIREYGILQPLVVTRVETETPEGARVEYELIAGERRLLAAKKIGLERVPAIVREQPREEREKLEMALVENIQRSSLNPLDTARAYAKLQDEFGLSQREVAQRLGKSREAVANTLRLLQLPREIQKALIDGKINESHARILLQAKDYATQMLVFSQTLEHNLSVRAAQELVEGASVAEVTPREYPKDIIDPRLDSARRRLEETLGAQVKLVKKGQKGKITIKFYSEEELQKILDTFLGGM